MDMGTAAKYPFLEEVVKYIKRRNLKLEEILSDPLYGRGRALGKTRVREALEYGEVKEHDFSTEAARLMEILSYPVARMLVSCINDSFLQKRYALAESVRVYERMLYESQELILQIAQELGLEISIRDELFKIHFSAYLKFSSGLRGSNWKIVNRALEKGYITLNKKDLVRVIQEAVRIKIEAELPLKVSAEIDKSLEREIKEIKSLLEIRKKAFEPKSLGKVTILKFPPCMRNLIAMIESGENVPHAGRFALTSFLYAIGMGRDEILRIFSTAPDFDEKKARYQIEHITGKISSTTYTPPECSTMKTYGLCVGEDALCKKEWLTHPLKYYRTKEKKKI